MRTNGHGKPVVALDIDGTLGDYHGHFLKFAEAWFGHDFPSPDEINPGFPLHQFMGVFIDQYRQCKLAYRQGGLKRSMPCYPGAASLCESIQELGAEVWICTTRPYLRLDNIDPDTREWLARNKIPYDAVLFDRIDEKGSKYAELAEQAGDRVVAILDDLPEMVASARELLPGAKVYLRDQPYNRHVSPPGADARRVYSLLDAGLRIMVDMKRWKAAKA
jgi:uncharacterized HAD superfamily protein